VAQFMASQAWYSPGKSHSNFLRLGSRGRFEKILDMLRISSVRNVGMLGQMWRICEKALPSSR